MATQNDGKPAKRRGGGTSRGSKNTVRQKQLTRAACEVFAKKGYSAASIQDVADKVGVLKGSLYYYIQSKEDLLWRIIEDVDAQSSLILDEALALDLAPMDLIRVYIVRHVEWYLNNIAEVAVFFRDWRHLGDERLSVARSRRGGYEKVIRDLIASAQDAGDISPNLNVKYASMYVLAAVNAVPDWYRPDGKDSASRIAESFANITVGLLTGTPRAVEPLSD